MRVMTRNKQKIKYAELLGVEPVYELDENGNRKVDFVDDQGVTHYVTTGEDVYFYENPHEEDINIALSGGEVSFDEFGVNPTDYDATLVYELNKFPITETCLVWYQTEPRYIGENLERRVDPDSADYRVVKVIPSLNQTKVLLSKLITT